MWDKTKLKSVKNLYKEEVLQIPAIFKNKDDYVAFLMAQSYQESGWNEESVSKTGCKGFA